MGLEWLESVRAALKSAGYRTELGYPGKSAVHLGGTVAAVNLTGVDTGQGTAKVTVTILTPRSEGLARCQIHAAAVVQTLIAAGGQWSFSGWQYDNGIDCYTVEVTGQAPYSQSSGGGYQVLIGEVIQDYVTGFLARQEMDRRLIRPHGQAEPVGVTPGMGGWTIKLTQLIPSGQAEPEEVTEPFTLTVKRGERSQVYTGCCWSEYSSQQQDTGTQVERSGFALSREVT